MAIANIELMSPEDKRRLADLQVFVKAKHFENQGKGYAFFKIMNYYKTDKLYAEMFGRKLVDELCLYRKGTVCESLI
jgi:hypothetical protein